MFWLLLILFFTADGTKQAQVRFEPTEQACKADAEQHIADIHASQPSELAAAGYLCEGPLDDPTVPKTKV